MFGLREGKRRKRQLAQVLWQEQGQAEASAEVREGGREGMGGRER